MKFIVSASTDQGKRKSSNQDSLSVRLLEACGMQMVFAVLCDGMGGLEKGELASASVIYAFRKWQEERLGVLLQTGLQDSDIRREWGRLIYDCNEKIKLYGRENSVKLGTTATVLLMTPYRYYIANLGDSRAYALQNQVVQLTRDHSLVAREVELGNLPPDQAETDPRGNILLQCIGASEEVYPDFFFGTPRANAVYFLCSDGFRHKITQDEMMELFAPHALVSVEDMRERERALINLCMERGEKDNISVITIKTFE